MKKYLLLCVWLLSAVGAVDLPYRVVGTGVEKSVADPKYQDNTDGTITDLQTGLMWVKARGEMVTYADAKKNAATCRVGNYDDWRLPTIKELYSLILFTGANGNGNDKNDGYVPFIDTKFFDFAYGDPQKGARIIDAQDWTATPNLNIQRQRPLIFGVNFTDGRIKSYPIKEPRGEGEKKLYVRYVRDNPQYGKNDFHDNGNGTITDRATGLMWSKDDAGAGLDYAAATAFVEQKNREKYRGYNDWRLPTIKELHTLVDYTRAPDVNNAPAIDPTFFNITKIKNEAGNDDYPFFWSSTPLTDRPRSTSQTYIAFGRALGFMRGNWHDVHGAGAQRSDPIAGDPKKFPEGRGPQGDAIRIYNFVRLVRDAQ